MIRRMFLLSPFIFIVIFLLLSCKQNENEISGIAARAVTNIKCKIADMDFANAKKPPQKLRYCWDEKGRGSKEFLIEKPEGKYKYEGWFEYCDNSGKLIKKEFSYEFKVTEINESGPEFEEEKFNLKD